jgi:hypothetical protein
LYILITKYSGLNGTKHYPSSIPSSIYSWIRFSFVIIVPKYLNCATFSNNLLPVFMSWFWPAFWWWDSNVYLVFYVFTSRPTYLLASIKVCVFFFMVFILSPSRFKHLKK